MRSQAERALDADANPSRWRGLAVAFCVSLSAVCAAVPGTAEEFRPMYSIMFEFEKCDRARPNIGLIYGGFLGMGYDKVELAGGVTRFNQPVRTPSTFTEIKPVGPDGTGYCLIYDSRASVDDIRQMIDLKVGTKQVQNLRPIAVDGIPLAYAMDGLDYGVTLLGYPLPSGGAALAMQLSGVTPDIATALSRGGGPGFNWSPTNNLVSTHRMILSRYCMNAVEPYSAHHAKLRNSGATLTPAGTGTSATWRDLVFVYYAQDPAGQEPGHCQVSSTQTTLAEVNDIGRQFFDPRTGEFEEIEVGDGTRAWRKSAAPFQGAAPVGVVLAYSYRDANGAGLAVKAIPVTGGR